MPAAAFKHSYLGRKAAVQLLVRQLGVNEGTYDDCLHGLNLIGSLQDVARVYQANLALCKNRRDKAAFKAAAAEEFLRDPSFQYLLNGYPDQHHRSIAQLRNIHALTKEKIAACVQQLRHDYELSRAPIRKKFLSCHNDIGLTDYIQNYSEAACEMLISKNPGLMLTIHNDIRACERQKIAECRATLNNKRFYQTLKKFKIEISKMKVGNGIDQSTINHFNQLYYRLDVEIFSHAVCDVSDTVYPAVVQHFTQLAHQLNTNKPISEESMAEAAARLDQRIANKPMSKRLKALMCGVIGAVIGVAIGFTVGAAVTCWGGSFAALPAAIYGGILGFSLAQGLVVGGVAAGTGMVTGVLATTFGMFSANQHKARYEQKQKDYAAIKSSFNEVNEACEIAAIRRSTPAL